MFFLLPVLAVVAETVATVAVGTVTIGRFSVTPLDGAMKLRVIMRQQRLLWGQ